MRPVVALGESRQMASETASYIVGFGLLVALAVILWALRAPDDKTGEDEGGGGGGGLPRRPAPRPRGPHGFARSPAPARIRIATPAHRRRLPARDSSPHRAPR